MSGILQKIDSDLTELEEALLGEFRRLRKLETEDSYSQIDADVKTTQLMTLDALKDALEHSGDLINLSLRTREHETLQARMEVSEKLLKRRIPTRFIDVSHAEVKQARQQLEFRVADARSRQKPLTPEQRLARNRIFEDKPRQELSRNPDRITPEEEQVFETGQAYEDKGIYSASRELAVLAEQVALHHEEGQSIEEVMKARAQFDSKELSKGHEVAKEAAARIAQSPDEIRRKLQNRGATTSGASTFASRELSNQTQSEPPKPPSRRRSGIAQSPEEIRRKLEARKAEEQASKPSAGKAVFGSKDIESIQQPRARTQPPAPKPEPEKPTGKAVFGSKDIESVADINAKIESKKKPEKEPTKPAGKAIFESRDLSDKDK